VKHTAASSGAVPPERRFFRLLGGIAALAVVLRLGVAWEFAAIDGGWNSVFHPPRSTDLATYMRLAAEIAEGKFQGAFYYQPFYYAVFLPLIHLVCGASVWAVIAAQSLLGGATAFLAGLCGRRFGGPAGGLLAAGLTAISTPLLLYAPFHQNETLHAFLLILLFLLTLRALESPTPGRAAALGLAAAAAILNRGNLWLFVPLLLLALFLGVRRAVPAGGERLRRFALCAALFAAALLLPMLPFVIRNTLETGHLCGPSTAADAVLALGNTLEAPAGGRDPGLPAGPMEYPESFGLAMARAEKGVSVPRQMFGWLLHAPGSFLELQFRKLLLFWDYREIPNNVSLYGEGEHSVILRLLVVGRSAVVLTLGVAALVLGVGRLRRRREAPLLLLYGFILLYWGTIAVFYNLSRFRAPVLPLVAVSTALLPGIRGEIRDLAGEQRRRAALTALLGFAFAAWLVLASYECYRRNCEAAVMRLVRPDGVELALADGARRIFDHGPYTFGGWEAVPITAGAVAEKEFAPAALRDAREGVLELMVLAERPGLSRWRNAAGAVVEKTLAAGENRVEFPVPLDDGKCAVTALELPAGAALVCDRQRAYGRSRLDGKVLAGEWRFRLTVR